eukprot:TRINITY_DN651_c0_g1_i1.p1 TRINITY_DN651_c0_g1~~TRINITY_DN651_c0_g1_i1.p1  ORF type:complete len:746 (-),score=124.95 TRINITY_DN651_c0_g1_i1:589-2826(-)
MVSLSSLITSLLTSFAIFAVLVTIFTILSRYPANYVIFYPARILAGLGPPDRAKRRTPFTWIKEAWEATEDDLVNVAGLDATVYVIFQKTALKILGLSSVLCLLVLIPIAATDKGNEIAVQKEIAKAAAENRTAVALSFSDIDKAAMGNVQEKSQRIWAFVLVAYFVSIVTYFTLLKTYKHVLALRTLHRGSAKPKPEQFTILVRDIPPAKSGTLQDKVDAFFKKLHPDTYEKCLIVTTVKKAAKAYGKVEKLKAKLARAEAIFAGSKTKATPGGVRPLHKVGTCGLYGAKVDSIDTYGEEIKMLTPKLEEEQGQAQSNEEGAAFCFFNSRRAAAAAGQCVHAPRANTWQTQPAPEPREVIWTNLSISFYSRSVRELVVYGIVFLTVVFYMIPIGIISALTTLENLQKTAPFIKPIVKIGVLKSVLEAYLPQLALIIFLALLPKLLLFLSKMEGIVAQSQIVRAAAGKYFYFIVFNVFLGVTIGGSLFSSGKAIAKDPGSIVSLLATSLPPSATFFITFVALKFFVGYGLELSRFVPLILYHLKRRFLAKSEKEIEDAWAPGCMDYTTAVPNDMLVITIALCYAVIAPLIIPFSILYFAFGWLVLRNQALKVYVPDYESGGRMWPHIHSRILAALFVSQLTNLGYFALKKFPYAILLLPLPFATVVFAYLCRKFYYKSFTVVSLSEGSNDLEEVPTVASMVEAYTPNCLLGDSSAEMVDAEEFEDARSNMSSRTSSGIMSPAPSA